MLEFPYGLADFRRIREQGMVYVDRTANIPTLERLGSNLVFLRPRRFGKSLWLQTLASYYDLRLADAFDDLFGGLAVGPGGRHGPTPNRNRYFVLQWNFSLITPASTVPEIAESLCEHVSVQAENFVSAYRDQLPGDIDNSGSPVAVLDRILKAVRRTPYKLYLLIDEYDNFVNEVMVSNLETYRNLFAESGPFKVLFKSIKNAFEGKGLERAFITGVSPVALNDLTSGFNTATNLTLHPRLTGLCGFTEEEVRGLMGQVAAERQLSDAEVAENLDLMRTWYNGYRFSDPDAEMVYNPTSVLYFLRDLHLEGRPPKRLHDDNLRTDSRKLEFIARTAVGSGLVEDLTEGEGDVAFFQVETSFSVNDLLPRLATDKDTVTSFLYYMGLLSVSDVPDRLRIPNLVVRKLFLDRLLANYLSLEAGSEASQLTLRFFQTADLQPLLTFFEEKLFSVFSNRDQGRPPRKEGQSGSGVNETTVKSFFLATLFDDTRYVVSSELEVERSYVDLCLLARRELHRPDLFDFLFEFKYVRREELGKKGEELKTMDEEALRELTPVRKAFEDARDQAERYRERLRKRHPDLNLRSYAVVAVGLERLLAEEVPEE